MQIWSPGGAAATQCGQRRGYLSIRLQPVPDGTPVPSRALKAAAHLSPVSLPSRYKPHRELPLPREASPPTQATSTRQRAGRTVGSASPSPAVSTRGRAALASPSSRRGTRTLCSWPTPPPPPSQPLCRAPWVSSGRSSERSQTLLGDPPPWWSSSPLDPDQLLCWPPLHPAVEGGDAVDSSDPLDCLALFPQEPSPPDSYDSADSSPEQPFLLDFAEAPPLALAGADMALLSMFGAVPSGNALERNDDRGHGHQQHDMFPQDQHSFLGSSLHHGIPQHNSHHRQQHHIVFQDTLNGSQHGTTATTNDHTTTAYLHPYFSTTAKPSSTTAATLASSAASTIPQARQGPQGSLSPASAGSKRKQPASPGTGSEQDPDLDEVALKRHRNTMAARKYRQKRVDRIADLEKALADVTGERDELRLKLARREAEVEALREMLDRK